MSSETQLYTELFEDEDEFGEAISPDDAIRLQRGVSINTNVSSLRRVSSNGTGTLSVKEEEFADPKNLQTSVMYLRSSLQANGFPTDFNPESPTPEDAAKVCNLVYALLMQRQRDIKYAQESEQMKARLTSSLSTSESARSRLENRLQAQERSIGALENRVRSNGIMHKSDTSRMQAEAGDLNKINADLRGKQTQTQRELKRKDLEIERLQAKVHELLTSRKREPVDNQDSAGRYSESVQKAASLRRDGDATKRVIAEYEERLREVVQENKRLRSALDNLQERQRGILDNQAHRESQLTDMRRTKSQKWANEIADLTQAGMLKKMYDRMVKLDGWSESLCASVPASPAKDNVVKLDSLTVLTNYVESSRILLSEYMAFVAILYGKLEASLQYRQRLSDHRRSSIGSMETDESTHSGLHVSLSRLEDEYRAKVLELESKLATAQLHADGCSSGEESQEARVQVAQARQALDEEKSRIVQALEAQARELGLAKLEFETHRTVFAETMREFAPGFGAGAFLAKAMARNAAQAANERNDEARISEAGDDIVKRMGDKFLLLAK